MGHRLTNVCSERALWINLARSLFRTVSGRRYRVTCPPQYDEPQPLESNLNKAVVCKSLEQVREHIDRLDRQIVGLLAERGGYVAQAARFKKTTNDVKAPQRAEQVITRAVALSTEMGANPAVTEAVYRAMISAFIDAELTEHAALAGSGDRS